MTRPRMPYLRVQHPSMSQPWHSCQGEAPTSGPPKHSSASNVEHKVDGRQLVVLQGRHALVGTVGGYLGCIMSNKQRSKCCKHTS